MGLIKWVANEVSRRWEAWELPDIDFDDLVQIGFFGLLKAIDKFDPKKGVKFSTYAIHWIRQAMTRALEGRQDWISLDEPVVTTDEGDTFTRADLIEDWTFDPVEEAEKGDLKARLWPALKQYLNEEEYNLLVLRFVYDLEFNEIARHMGKAPEEVKKLYQATRRKMIFKLRIKLDKIIKPWLEEITPYYRSKSIVTFNCSPSYSHSSPVEDIVIWRERVLRELFGEGGE